MDIEFMNNQTQHPAKNIPWRSVEDVFAEMESRKSDNERREHERYIRNVRDEQEFEEFHGQKQ